MPPLESGSRVRALLRNSVMEIVLLALCIFLAFRADGFLSMQNFLNVLRTASFRGMIALGMTMVIIAGEIDLSVGSMVAFSGCLAAWLTGYLAGPACGMSLGSAVTLSIVASVLAALGIGCITGFLRVRFEVPTFITTLAWMSVLRGSASLITKGFPLTPFPEWYNFIGGGYLLGIPFPAIIFIASFAIIQVLMSYTSFGRAVYAVGGNAEAARLSGIKVYQVKVLVMAIVAGLAALSGIMQSAQIMSGSHKTAEGWELEVISAVIIGGTSLMGGVGRVWGTLIGVVFLGVLVNGMTLMSIDEYWQPVVRGALILGAVLINLAPSSRK
ncbi:MAG: ABC transporter permease [Planctomycetota bacterium]|nr:ABC transporter permease [Planctomycetota bacterium]